MGREVLFLLGVEGGVVCWPVERGLAVLLGRGRVQRLRKCLVLLLLSVILNRRRLALHILMMICCHPFEPGRVLNRVDDGHGLLLAAAGRVPEVL